MVVLIRQVNVLKVNHLLYGRLTHYLEYSIKGAVLVRWDADGLCCCLVYIDRVLVQFNTNEGIAEFL